MLKFIGIGSAFNTAEGNTSAYIKKEGKLFLIDCGSANFHFMKESGFLDDVDEIHVYITHTHADHVGSLADLILYMYYAKGEIKKRVTVYSEYSVSVGLYLRLNGVTNQYTYQVVDENEAYKLENFGIEFLPFRTNHVDELDSFGLFINDYVNNKSCIYTGDTNQIPEYINLLLENEFDYMYVDTCSQDYDGNVHLSLHKLHCTVKKEHRDRVWCMHLDEKFDKELARSLGFNVAEVNIQ